LKVHLHHFSKKKSQKEVTQQQESRFFLLFCLVMEGSWSGSVSGSIHLTNGSGSGSRRSKNIRIQRIRIRNTAANLRFLTKNLDFL
jgi:hypothetical protein